MKLFSFIRNATFSAMCKTILLTFLNCVHHSQISFSVPKVTQVKASLLSDPLTIMWAVQFCMNCPDQMQNMKEQSAITASM